MDKEYVGVVKNNDLRYTINDGQEFGSILQAQLMLAIGKNAESFEYKDVTYEVEKEGEDLYLISSNGTVLAIAAKDIVNAADGAEASALTFAVKHEALKAYANGETSFTADGQDYTMDADGNILSGSDEIGYVSRFVVQAKENGVVISRDFKEKLADAIDSDTKEFIYTDADGEEYTYTITYKPDSKTWSVLQSKETYVYDPLCRSLQSTLARHRYKRYGYADPSDVRWTCIPGDRIYRCIYFSVPGYPAGRYRRILRKWVDNLIMRIVDVFYCIPSTPLIIILGAAMDAMQLDPQIRMLYLMLVLGFLGWPSIARLVRGQILSLREQEFMTAAEACGIRASKRIFRHLVPNVIPQLIVTCTMSLGGTIITEATLSFLGLGVKFPFASWGNIINDVNNAYVMTNYWFIWIPAGICLLITVLGFNFVGDGLRDAFDPKMKR